MDDSTPRLLVTRLSPRAGLPRRMSDDAAGLDVAACLAEGERVRLAPGERALIPTGLALAIPAGYEGQVRPRSGLAVEHGISILNAPGTIDADYRGELKVILVNHGAHTFEVVHGERVAQLVIAPVAMVAVVEADELPASARGQGGLGSTGR
jgi:dUTP pyrophosphatase